MTGSIGQSHIQMATSQLRATKQAEIDETALEELFEQQIADQAAKEGLKELSNPLAGELKSQEKKLTDRKVDVDKADKSEIHKSKPLTKKELNDLAEQFAQKYPEFRVKDLVQLLERLQPNADKETILKVVFHQYFDLNQANIALEFLSKATGGDLQKQVEEARKELFAPINSIEPSDTQAVIINKLQAVYPYAIIVDQALDMLIEKNQGGSLHEQLLLAKEEIEVNYTREISTHRNISDINKKESEKLRETGLSWTESEMELKYLDYTNNPRETLAYFDELFSKYSPKQFMAINRWMLHALGADTKAEGPSMEPAKLHANISQTRKVQAIMGVFLVCEKRLPYIISQFEKYDLGMPPHLNSVTLAKELISLVSERYPSPEKVEQLAIKFGIEANIVGKIIVFSVYRDVIREISPHKLFRSHEHFRELHDAIIKNLERLESELELIEEQQMKEGST